MDAVPPDVLEIIDGYVGFESNLCLACQNWWCWLSVSHAKLHVDRTSSRAPSFSLLAQSDALRRLSVTFSRSSAQFPLLCHKLPNLLAARVNLKGCTGIAKAAHWCYLAQRLNKFVAGCPALELLELHLFSGLGYVPYLCRILQHTLNGPHPTLTHFRFHCAEVSQGADVTLNDSMVSASPNLTHLVLNCNSAFLRPTYGHNSVHIDLKSLPRTLTYLELHFGGWRELHALSPIPHCPNVVYLAVTLSLKIQTVAVISQLVNISQWFPALITFDLGVTMDEPDKLEVLQQLLIEHLPHIPYKSARMVPKPKALPKIR
eukprot:TRINITY_DN113238_c0_g1_i1.p1 TRINITY_DN113238_c0_g1~~TRINITY_DN113238_c0_g1_i1.p1  ORF type:complete len:317 (-),score=-9.26 TRINITY_DN113238_c0_g1_i1:39-989(-)